MSEDIVARLRSIGNAMGAFGSIEREAADEIERLRAEIARKDAALRFYANRAAYRTSSVYMSGKRLETVIEQDNGDRARATLNNSNKEK